MIYLSLPSMGYYLPSTKNDDTIGSYPKEFSMGISESIVWALGRCVTEVSKAVIIFA